MFDEVLARLAESFEVDAHDADALLDRAAFLERAAPARGLLVAASEPLDAERIAELPELRCIATMAVGYDNIDVAACRARGIVVTHAPDVLTETTADFGMALLLATARRVTEAERFLRAGQWRHWGIDLFAGAEVHGTTLGIVGMGRIGRAIARRATQGFRMKVLYHNRSRLAQATETEVGAEYVAHLDELLARSDHVMLVLPYSAANRHRIGAAELARMKPSATLINLARGGIVDDAALAQALAQRRIAAAGLDVFEGEPRVHPGLLEVPNVVLTPHIASASLPTRKAMAMLAADNLIAVLNGRPPLTPVPSA